MERLHRVTHRLVWVNPLKVTPGYAPLARGMAAALPYVDNFVEGHSVSAMEELTRVISETLKELTMRELLDEIDAVADCRPAGRGRPGRRHRGVGPARPGRGDGRQRVG